MRPGGSPKGSPPPKGDRSWGADFPPFPTLADGSPAQVGFVGHAGEEEEEAEIWLETCLPAQWSRVPACALPTLGALSGLRCLAGEERHRADLGKHGRLWDGSWMESLDLSPEPCLESPAQHLSLQGTWPGWGWEKKGGSEP